MCDWEEEEYAEYLLWAEAARAGVRVRSNSSSSEFVRSTENLDVVERSRAVA